LTPRVDDPTQAHSVDAPWLGAILSAPPADSRPRYPAGWRSGHCAAFRSGRTCRRKKISAPSRARFILPATHRPLRAGSAKHMVALMHKLLIPIIAATALASNPGSIQAEDVAQTKISLAKGPFGVGLMISKHLRHQDFPPVIRLYATPLSKPQDSSLTVADFEQRYSVWSTLHYPLAPFVADPRWREPHAGFASTQVTSNPDHCFTAPIYLTGLDHDARWDSLRLWCGGSACTYTQPAALDRCGADRKLSQHR
jgi:hypothetical protein